MLSKASDNFAGIKKNLNKNLKETLPIVETIFVIINEIRLILSKVYPVFEKILL